MTFAHGKRAFAWTHDDDDEPVIVVANFWYWVTPSPFDTDAEYLVPSWPAGNWHEVMLDRDAPPTAREPLFTSEAKVYRRHT